MQHLKISHVIPISMQFNEVMENQSVYRPQWLTSFRLTYGEGKGTNISLSHGYPTFLPYSTRNYLLNQTPPWHGIIPQFPDAENNLLKDMFSWWKSSELGPRLPDSEATRSPTASTPEQLIPPKGNWSIEIPNASEAGFSQNQSMPSMWQPRPQGNQGCNKPTQGQLGLFRSIPGLLLRHTSQTQVYWEGVPPGLQRRSHHDWYSPAGVCCCLVF